MFNKFCPVVDVTSVVDNKLKRSIILYLWIKVSIINIKKIIYEIYK